MKFDRAVPVTVVVSSFFSVDFPHQGNSSSPAALFIRCTTTVGIFHSKILSTTHNYLLNYGQKTVGFSYRKRNR